MKIRAYGFTVIPSQHVGIQDLLDAFEEIHAKKRKIEGKYRVFSFSGNTDANRFRRIGMLSIRDEKVVLQLVEEEGEITITPMTLAHDQVDFNLALLRVNRSGVLTGIMTSYRGALSMTLFEKRMRMANRRALRDAVKALLATGKEKVSVTDFIKENDLEGGFAFSHMISRSSFENLVASLEVIDQIDIHYDVFQYAEDDPEKLLERDIEVNRTTECIKLKGARHGSAVARRIKAMLTQKNPRRATVRGRLNGFDDSIDLHENPEVLWQKELDGVREQLKIKLKSFTDNPIFDDLSRRFADDPKF